MNSLTLLNALEQILKLNKMKIKTRVFPYLLNNNIKQPNKSWGEILHPIF